MTDQECKASARSIHEAASAGDARTVARLLRVNPDLVESRDVSGDTPLHVAARDNRSNVVRTLLSHGADVNARSTLDKMTPLHNATDSVEVARLLVRGGADLDARDDWGLTPLYYAAMERNYPPTQAVVRYLVKSGAYYDIQSAVAQRDAVRVEKILLENDAFMSSLSKVEMATTLALARKQPNIMRLLLEHGADANVRFRNKSGPGATFRDPPLSRESNPECVELLLRHGAKIDAKDSNGRTPMERARRSRLWDIVAVLKKWQEDHGKGSASRAKRSTRKK